MALQKDLQEFIESLNSNGVEYLIVGAYAVAFHGHPRLTGDLDLFVRRTPENAQRLSEAIAQFSGGAIRVGAQEFLATDKMLRLGNEPNRVDVLTSISGVEFSEAWERRVQAELGGATAIFIARDDLVRNKRATGRLKDISDAEELARE